MNILCVNIKTFICSDFLLGYNRVNKAYDKTICFRSYIGNSYIKFDSEIISRPSNFTELIIQNNTLKINDAIEQTVITAEIKIMMPTFDLHYFFFQIS